MADGAHRSISESVEGTELGDFRANDWGQLIVAAGIFGSAFLWIALALRTIDPGTIAFGRAALGATEHHDPCPRDIVCHGVPGPGGRSHG